MLVAPIGIAVEWLYARERKRVSVFNRGAADPAPAPGLS